MLATSSQRGGPIIWPLRAKLFHPVFLQQRPRWTGWRPIPVPVASLPWAAFVANVATRVTPRVVHAFLPKPAHDYRIFGITKDSTGAVLANCTVKLYTTADDTLRGTVTSGADGTYEFRNRSPFFACYVVAYKVGSPDLSGTTINTLTGV